MSTLQMALHDFLRLERSPKTTATYRNFLTRLITAIGPARDVRRVSFDDLADFFDALRAGGARASTLGQYAIMVKAFFNWCVRQRLLKDSPAADLHFRNPGRAPGSRAIPADILSAMLVLARPHPRNYALLLFLIDTGCRRGGCASLTLGNLALDEGRAVLLEKGGKWHTAYFGAETAAALGAWLAVRPRTSHDRVWTTTGASALALGASGISSVIHKLSVKAGAPHPYGPHAIRHAVGEAYADAGVPPTVLQHKLGHASPRVTLEHYYPHDENRVRDTSHRMPLAPLQNQAPPAPPRGGKIIDIRHFGS